MNSPSRLVRGAVVVLLLVVFSSKLMSAEPQVSVRIYVPGNSWITGTAMPLVVEIQNDGASDLSLTGLMTMWPGRAELLSTGRTYGPVRDHWVLTVWFDAEVRRSGAFVSVMDRLPEVTVRPGDHYLMKLMLRPSMLVDGDNILQASLQRGRKPPVYSEAVVVHGDDAVRIAPQPASRPSGEPARVRK